MGTFSPAPFFGEKSLEEVMKNIMLPTVSAMNAEGRPFKGVLYFGLMKTKDGYKVIEYNSRFGDPETQVVLPLLESDLFTVMQATANGTLAGTEVKFADKSAACVVLASRGYPEKYETGFPMSIPAEADREADTDVYVAGAKKDGDVLLSAGGRVLGCVKVAPTLEEAIAGAYRLADSVKFENAYCRRDIGQRALKALR
jgi:phosphoribosylamine--glycine ligase